MSDPRFRLPAGALFNRPTFPVNGFGRPIEQKGAKPAGKAKSATPGASVKPHQCAILALDTAATTGASFLVPELWSFKTPRGDEVTRDIRILWTEIVKHPRPELFARASEQAKALGLPLMICGEQWGSGNQKNDPRATKKMMGGLNASWGKYDLCREMAGIAKGRVTRFYPHEWQPAIVGPHLKGMEPKERKREIQLYLKRHYDLTVSEDEADSCCIGLYGMRDRRVREAIPLRKIG